MSNIRAFKVNSVDYLLKPIDEDDLAKAVEKCKIRLQQTTSSADVQGPINLPHAHPCPLS